MDSIGMRVVSEIVIIQLLVCEKAKQLLTFCDNNFIKDMFAHVH